LNKIFNKILIEKMGIGDWGLGIGDSAQSPIPNPQSPIPNPQSPFKKMYFLLLIYVIKIKIIILKNILK